MIVALAKGQEELKAMIVKKNTKKTKRTTSVAHMSRRFRGPPTRVVDLASSSKEGENQEGEAREEDLSPKDLTMKLVIMRSSTFRLMKSIRS